MSYFDWQQLHRFSALAFLLFSALHLWLHRRWWSALFEKRLFRRNKELLIFSALFLISTILGVVAWLLVPSERLLILGLQLVEVHDKVSILFAVFALLHIVRRLRRASFTPARTSHK